MASITTINPATNSVIKTYACHSQADIEQALRHAEIAFRAYRYTTFSSRSMAMNRAAELLEEKQDELASIMTEEMGKTRTEARAEIEKCAWVCRYYAAHSEAFLADETIKMEASKSYISYQPLGVILAIMPWNFPFWQVFRFAAPALMAGNVALLKHASNVPECALQIAKIFMEAGFPEHVFQTLIVKSDQVAHIIAHPTIKAVTLTGSSPAGAAVASVAGKYLKKTVLELGGSDPYLILADADIELAVSHCIVSRLLNAGQSCIGAKRFIVVDEVYQDFLARFEEAMQAAKCGDPHLDVDLGPLARHDLRDEVHEQVLASIRAGAELRMGGTIIDHPGAYYPPTILTNVKPGMPAYDEEIFGPVASIIRAKSEEEAIHIANDTIFGLGSCIFTKDVARGEKIARERIDAGCCFVNQFVKSDPRLPFGGIKASGFGRELSYLGIREFVNIKTVYVA